MASPGFIKISQRLFFDSEKVLKALENGERRALVRNAGFIRTIARRSLRSAGKKGKVSQPGEPPRSVTGKLKKFLNFSYDPATRSAVIGPEGFGWLHFTTTGLDISEPIPAILEYGGEYRVFEERYTKGPYKTLWSRVDLRRTDRKAWLRFTEENGGRGFVSDKHGVERETRMRTVRIAKRPYMRPALDKARPRLIEMWKDTMNKAA